MTQIIPITTVTVILLLLIYFSWKTIITNNYYQKGLTQYQQQDYPAAETEFRRVIAINKTNDVVHLLLGDTLMQQNRIPEAIAQFQEVIERAPKKADAYLRLSNALMQQNPTKDTDSWREAIANLETARDLLQKQRNTQEADKITKLLAKLAQTA
jgi:tetratricopeptide (TPR) repeat protein